VRARLATAVVAVAVLAAGTVPSSGPVAAAPQDCVKRDGLGNCVTQLPVPIPGTPASQTPEPDRPGRGGGPTGPVSPCLWVTVADPPASSQAAYPDAPPDAIWQVFSCGGIQGENSGMGFRWLPPGGGPPAPPTPPPANAVAALVYARVEASMVAPALASDPAPGVASVVNTPVFVEVTNWQPEIVAGPECVLGVCITMTATPTLSFDPGDGSPATTCDPPGSRYVPGGPPMAEQAQGACAHTYLLRTGAEDRPGEWPGEVTVTWQVSWTSNVPGAGGTYDPLVFSTALPRAVDEVRTVVVDGSS
jgi:hypothetical protein